ncbi:MAG: IPTL-CTERM sorting domain-containing protein [candidate division Zixibacteria bacterium]|nr:IPTL-CTERM sorting domain-containing protein [candidate division Zixibacteria bacterium]
MFNRSSALSVMAVLFMVALLATSAFAAAETPAKPEDPQAKAASPETIPTLGEWGLIIFSVLLVGWMAWVIVRRRRPADIQM